MSLFFFCINALFAGFFFLFWHQIEAGAFAILAVVSFFSFNSFFRSLKEKDEAHQEEKRIQQKAFHFPLQKVVGLIKKGSYYLAFLFFYISLYGMLYGANLLYGDFDNFALFQGLLFGISLVVTIVFFGVLQKKNETVFLLFRSNFIIFSVLSALFLLFSLFSSYEYNWLFTVNVVFSLLWVAGILYFDPFFGKKKEYIYGPLLCYFLLIVYFYTHSLFPEIQKGILLFSIASILSMGYFEYLPRVSFLKAFSHISKNVGILMNYVSFVGIFLYMGYYSITPFLFLLSNVSAGFHLWVHRRFKNYISLSLVLVLIVFFYTKFLFSSTDWFFASALFIFLLPACFIGSTFVLSIRDSIDRYFLHYSALIFSFVGIVYYFIQVAEFDILKLSTMFLLESLLLFASYVWVKK